LQAIFMRVIYVGGHFTIVTDSPTFVPARDSRLLQFADSSANAAYGIYRSKLTSDFDLTAQSLPRRAA